jgi:hypothetical protein
VASTGRIVNMALALVGMLVVAGVGRAFASTVRRAHAVVGRDGLTIHRGSKTQFIGFSELRDVRRIPPHARPLAARGAVSLSLPDRDVVLQCGSFAADDPSTLSALAQRIHEGWEAFKAGHSDEEAALELLERRGRPIAEWRAAIVELVREGADYRAARLNPVHLTETVEDPAAPIERRLGAAVALASRPDHPELRKRVFAAARTCAHPRLRIALEKAAGGELEVAALEEAIEEEAVKQQAKS